MDRRSFLCMIPAIAVVSKAISNTPPPHGREGLQIEHVNGGVYLGHTSPRSITFENCVFVNARNIHSLIDPVRSRKAYDIRELIYEFKNDQTLLIKRMVIYY